MMKLPLLVFCLLLSLPTFAQKVVLAHYNVENLFDTINDPKIEDEEFLPASKKEWSSVRYAAKLDKLAQMISSINNGKGPDLLGLCEVENRAVLTDLVKQKQLKKSAYQIVHFDSPDGRGIDVAFLYRKKSLKKVTASSHRISDPAQADWKTRDVLLVSGHFANGQRAHFMVNHWPSRLGGQEKSEPKRKLAAAVVKALSDSIRKADPNAAIFVLGDLNDSPVDKSLLEVLATDTTPMQGGSLYNPFHALAATGEGSIVFQKNYQLIDHIVVSTNTLNTNAKLVYVPGSAAVHKPDFARETEERFKGNPFRTYAGNKYLGGYSDHFPVYIQLELRK